MPDHAAKIRATLTGLASAALIAAAALADLARVDPPLPVSEWAEKHRIVASDSGSPQTGAWSNDYIPALVQIMDVMGHEHPCRSVRVRGSAQTGKSECGLNAIFARIDQAPCGILILLPSDAEAKKYNRVKFDNSVRDSPRVRTRVARQTGRSGEQSTTSYKKFAGGFGIIGSAGTSNDLQMITVGLFVAEEVTQYENDVDGRGHPLDQGRKRGIAFGDMFKDLVISTPGETTEDAPCRMTVEFEAGDQRWPYAPCAHCGDYLRLAFDLLSGPTEQHPDEPVGFDCPGCGCKTEDWQRHDMLADVRWVPCFESTNEANPKPGDTIPASEIGRWAQSRNSEEEWTGGRDTERRPISYQLWRAVNPQLAWALIWKDKREMDAGLVDAPTFWQQTVGLPYERGAERPDTNALMDSRGAIYAGGGQVPPWACVLTGAADVQHDRIEWAVYAFGRGFTRVRLGSGIVCDENAKPIDPKLPAAWSALGKILEQKWAGPNFTPASPSLFAVDSGGHHTAEVYRFAMAWKQRGAIAIKGRSGPKAHEAFILEGSKKPRIVRGVNGKRLGKVALYLVNTHELKGRLYTALDQGVVSADLGQIQPRAFLLGPDVSEDDIKQLTAETLQRDDPRKRAGLWVKIPGQANEQLDMAVYAEAAAWNIAQRWGEDEWARRYEQVLPDPVTKDAAPMETLWSDTPAPPPAEAHAPSKAGGLTEEDRERLKRIFREHQTT
ncbi:MAG: terminase gpA endonuclease subunit [Pseudomonadota bacterium]